MTPSTDRRSSGRGVIEALAAGVEASIAHATRTESGLASFAFREGGERVELPPATSHRYFIGRVLGAAADPATMRLLEATRDGDVPVAVLLGRDDLGVAQGDRVALAERIGAAAAVGLVGRELDGDRVACTPLGEALLDLVEALEIRVRQPASPAGGSER